MKVDSADFSNRLTSGNFLIPTCTYYLVFVDSYNEKSKEH